MWARSISSNVECAQVVEFADSFVPEKVSMLTQEPFVVMAACSIMFCNSRTFPGHEYFVNLPIVTFVDEESCIGCGNCIEVCPYGAIELKEGGKRGQVAEVNPGLCKGCGTCPGACPSSSIQQLGFTDGQILAMIKALANGGD